MAVVAFDQLTKAAAAIAPHGRAIHPMRNDAFSLQAANAGRWTEVALMALGILGAALLGQRWMRRGVVPAWAVGLVLGGAASNLVDRILLGGVRDFLVLGPVVVNLADLAAVVGVAVAMWGRLADRARTAPAQHR